MVTLGVTIRILKPYAAAGSQARQRRPVDDHTDGSLHYLSVAIRAQWAAHGLRVGVASLGTWAGNEQAVRLPLLTALSKVG
ncbi:hypothetical protein GCM10028771_09800 [Nocardioides marmoraquaticus]